MITCPECGKPHGVEVTIPGVDFIDANFCGDECRDAAKVRKSLQDLETKRRQVEWDQSLVDWMQEGMKPARQWAPIVVRVKDE